MVLIINGTYQWYLLSMVLIINGTYYQWYLSMVLIINGSYHSKSARGNMQQVYFTTDGTFA
jgi:hypothetical protein